MIRLKQYGIECGHFYFINLKRSRLQSTGDRTTILASKETPLNEATNQKTRQIGNKRVEAIAFTFGPSRTTILVGCKEQLHRNKKEVVRKADHMLVRHKTHHY